VIEQNVALWMPVLLLISKGGLLPLNLLLYDMEIASSIPFFSNKETWF
jgi:hypothetical protein